jgi:hypothetical protein
VNPAAGVLAPAPGRLSAPSIRRAETADRIRVFLVGRLAAHRPGLDLVLPLAVLSVVSAGATLAAPALRGNPLLLMALTPRLPFLVLAARRIGPVPFVAVGTVRLCLADPFHFRLGRRLGRSAGGGAAGAGGAGAAGAGDGGATGAGGADAAGAGGGGATGAGRNRLAGLAGGRWFAGILGGRWFARLAGHRLARPASVAAVVVRPNGRNLALAGAVGLRAGLVAALDLGGTVLYLAGLHAAAALLH